MDYRGASNALGSDDRDILLSAMSGGEQDISVKVVSCHNAVNKAFQHRPAPSITAQRAVGEIMACTLLLGSGMKDNETLQVTIQGNGGLRRVVACTDHLLNVRASVSDASYELKDIATDTPMSTMALFGEGQISVLRNHPSYKQPMNGIVAIRNADIALNMALYISESEQRRCAVLLQTAFKGFKCVDAVGIYVEAFPYAMDSNVELAIRNLEAVNKAGLLNAYKSFSVPEDTFETFPEQTEMQTVRKDCPNAHRLIDAVLTDGLSNSMRWKRDVDYKCTCSMDNVWRAIAALPKAQLKDIINEFPTSVKVQFHMQTITAYEILLHSHGSYICYMLHADYMRFLRMRI
jgi:molecular chaperone Hsp33